MSKGRAIPYRNLGAKGEEGDYSDLVPPLDFLILEKLPEEGELALGLYPQGETAANLAKVHFKPLTATQIASRLRVMNALKLVKTVRGISHAAKESWQRTPKGKEVYETWKASQSK